MRYEPTVIEFKTDPHRWMLERPGSIPGEYSTEMRHVQRFAECVAYMSRAFGGEIVGRQQDGQIMVDMHRDDGGFLSISFSPRVSVEIGEIADLDTNGWEDMLCRITGYCAMHDISLEDHS